MLLSASESTVQSTVRLAQLNPFEDIEEEAHSVQICAHKLFNESRNKKIKVYFIEIQGNVYFLLE